MSDDYNDIFLTRNIIRALNKFCFYGDQKSLTNANYTWNKVFPIFKNRTSQ